MIEQIIVSLVLMSCVTGQSDIDFEEAASSHVPQLLSEATVVEATVGGTVTFPCAVDDIGVFVRLWKKGKTDVLFAGPLRIIRVDRFQLINNSSLEITSVLPKDSGEYVCTISTNPTLDLVHTLNVLYPPTVKPVPKDGFVTVKEGETVTLSCDTTGNPPPRISWKHAGRNYDITNGKDFLISNAVKGSSGEYECIADNGIGAPASAIITVEVVSAPKVYPDPKSGLLVVKEGEEISIGCEASGDPTPVITWKKPGSGDKMQKNREEDKIVITQAHRNHAGAYECIANNSLGVFTSAVIRVQVLYPPEIKVPNPWVHAGEGSTVNLTCIVKGEPVPSVMWKKGDGHVIHSNENYHLRTSGHHHTLQIHHLREEDFGRYECIASNSLSSKAENIHIIGTPQVPSITSSPKGSQSTAYTLVWVVKSHSPVQEYSLIYRKKSNGEDWITVPIAVDPETGNIQTYTYHLTGLQPATSYEAVVTAKNKFGWSKQSETFIFATKQEDKRSEAISASSSYSCCSSIVVVFQVMFVIMVHHLLH